MLVEVERQFRFTRRALGMRKVFMEISADGCALAHRVAGYVDRAYAACSRAIEGPRAPNVVPVICDGVFIPLPEASVDAALSDGLIERLLPRDALEHLRSVRRALREGGRYFCITGHRLCAPVKAPGLYRFNAEGLRQLFAEAGFRGVRFYARIGGVYAEVPYWLLRAAEGILGALPYRLRRAFAGNAVARALLGLYAEALN